MKKIVLVSFLVFLVFLSGAVLFRLRINLFPEAFSQTATKASSKARSAVSGPSDMPIPPELLNEQSKNIAKTPVQKPSTLAPQPTVAAPMAPLLPALETSQSAATAASMSPQAIDPSIKFINTEGFSYDPTGRRDPFKSYLSVARRDEMAKEQAPYYLRPEEGGVESLESYDITLFRLVGVLWDVGDPKAMVMSPTGKVFMVHKQTKIGKNNGYIASIREGEIVVVELAADGKTPSTRVLSLQK